MAAAKKAVETSLAKRPAPDAGALYLRWITSLVMFAVPVESKQLAQKKARVEVKSCGFFQKPNVKAATVPVPAGSGFVDNPLQKFGFTVQQKLKDGRVVDVAASSKAREPQHLCGVCGKGCFSPGALATHSAAHSAEKADPLAISVKDFWDLGY